MQGHGQVIPSAVDVALREASVAFVVAVSGARARIPLLSSRPQSPLPVFETSNTIFFF